MHNDEISFKVCKLVCEQLNKKENEVSLDKTLDELGADSLDQIEILMRTEEMFDVFVTDELAEKIVNIGDLVGCVNKLVQK